MIRRLSLAAALAVLLAAGPGTAQSLRLFDSIDALDTAIAGHMEARTFSALVEEVAPPSRMSLGRVRILEETRAGQIPPLRQSVALFRSETEGGVRRTVTAWWDGGIYVFVGLLTHAREDGVAVLDFQITGDVRQATRWFLTGDAQ